MYNEMSVRFPMPLPIPLPMSAAWNGGKKRKKKKTYGSEISTTKCVYSIKMSITSTQRLQI